MSLTLLITLREWWQWSYAQVCSFLYFHRISLIDDSEIPEGPVLFLGTHRNGILDALIYSNVLGPMTFVLAKRLHRTLLGRFFFGGIGVVRDKDLSGGVAESRMVNRQALKECRNYLVRGRRVFMFPEGSSALGPRLQEIKPGAAKIALSALRARPDLKVVPVSVLYDRAWGFRSRAQVKLGSALELGDIMRHPRSEQFDLVHRRICDALHELAHEFTSAEEQEACEVADNVRELTEYSDTGTAPAKNNSDVEASWKSLKEIAQDTGARRYNRVPLFHEGDAAGDILKVIGLGPFVAFMALVNAPILLGARLAGQKLAKAPNVISLYRLFAGLPLMFIWGALTFAGLFTLGLTELWFLSIALSLVGLGSYDTVMRSWTLLRNKRKGSRFKAAFEEFARSAAALPIVS